MAWAGGVFTKDNLFPRHIPNLTEPDLTPTEVRLPLPAAFGRIEPTVIAFIFARHNNLLVLTYEST